MNHLDESRTPFSNLSLLALAVEFFADPPVYQQLGVEGPISYIPRGSRGSLWAVHIKIPARHTMTTPDVYRVPFDVAVSALCVPCF